MAAIEAAARRLDPRAIPALREGLLSTGAVLRGARQEFLDRGLPPDPCGRALAEACRLIVEAVQVFGEGADLSRAFLSVLRALRKGCQAQEALFPLCRDVPEIDRYFLEPGAGACGNTCPVHRNTGDDPYGRAGYSLYVPGSGEPGRPRPLVVAFHGGYGHGRDFLWTWLREARSRGFLLMAPTSAGPTWSLTDRETDAAILRRHVDEVCSVHGVDRTRILLTGMSDGGTFALAFGLGPDCPAAAVAPVSCVLPPVDLAHARGRRILWVHGALDWMFPLNRAVRSCEDLSRAGADVRLRVVPDLSHAYPREENGAILEWFDRGLAKAW